MDPSANTIPDQSRRALLRGQLRSREVVRPPGALPESEFLSLCTRCDECIDACEESILVRGDGGFPSIDFRRGGCTFCGTCARACKPGAIVDAAFPPWSLKANIGKGCLEAKGVACRTCGDACEERAIRFRLLVGGRAELQLDREACTGCGLCVAICPVNAIRIAAQAVTESLSAPELVQTSQPEELA